MNPRKFFRLTRRIKTTDYTALWTFYQAHLVKPFWFYLGTETTPPWHTDPSGSDPLGRYVVVFDGSWSDAIAIGRSQASFGLREVA